MAEVTHVDVVWPDCSSCRYLTLPSSDSHVHNDDEVIKGDVQAVQGEVPRSPIFIMKVASQPPASSNIFSVENCPCEQFVRLRCKFHEKEDIKIEAIVFDGCVSDPKPGDDADGEDIRLYLSLLVDIYKGEDLMDEDLCAPHGQMAWRS
ncbi:hypothetical protein SOVF_005750 [Spinacia oleracea]|nr:hypothetical protein SOVF_005750 [Spinacia oleracea]